MRKNKKGASNKNNNKNKLRKKTSALSRNKKRPLKSSKLTTKIKEPKRKLAGKVTHYFNKIKVAVIKLATPVSVGNRIDFLGNKSNFSQKISSMQVDHIPVKKCKKGQLVGLKVQKKARVGDLVYFTLTQN